MPAGVPPQDQRLLAVTQTPRTGPRNEVSLVNCLAATLLKSAAISLALAGVTASVATAQTATPRGSSVVYIPGAAAFDWRAKKAVSRSGTVTNATLVSTESQPTVKKQRFFGHGSYICSPAGFGRKSTCFTR
jgi:hypothetical protein